MSKPILNSNTAYAWDANFAHSISFQYYGNQSMKNRMIVRNNSTNLIVYDVTQTTMLLQHTIAADALKNNLLYNVQVQAIDSLNVASELSDPVLFYCLDTPVFNINVTNNQVIRTPSYQVITTYTQAQNEQLQEYKICLYDANHIEIYNTGSKYSLDMPVILSSLNDNSTYYIQGFGRTVNNMNVQTELLGFTVDYIQPILYAYLKPENRPEQGDILLTMNFVSIEGHMQSGSTENYYTVNDKTLLNLQDGQKVIFDEGFSISGDFILNLKIKTLNDIINNQAFLSMKNDKDSKLELFLNQGVYTTTNHEEKIYVVLKATSGQLTYTIYSNYINYNATGILSIWLSKSNNLYNVHIESQVI